MSGTALGGEQTVSTKRYPGKVIVLNVWGSWCPPCRAEAPALQAASEQTKDKAQFIGITVKDPAPAAAEAFVKQNGITYPSIFDPTGAVLLSDRSPCFAVGSGQRVPRRYTILRQVQVTTVSPAHGAPLQVRRLVGVGMVHADTVSVRYIGASST